MSNVDGLKNWLKLPRGIIVGALLSVIWPACAFGQSSAAASASAPRQAQCRAVIVGSMPGNALLARRYQDWMKRFHAMFVKAGVKAENILLLSGDKSFKDSIVTGQATAQSVRNAIAEAGGKCEPGDQFVLILIGQGSTADAAPAFVLPGTDLTAEDLTKALASVNAQTQVVLNFSNSGGGFIKPLAAKGRINVSATSPDESAQSVMAEFFLKTLEAAPKEGLALLDVVNQSAYQTALFLGRQKQLEDGTWQVTGKQSVALFKKLYCGDKDADVRVLAETSDGSVDDPIVDIVPPTDAEAAKQWGGRRLVDEHAVLEDCGLESGVSPLRGPKGYDPIVPAKPDTEGFLASKVILGRPVPIKAEK